jgi:hypothetical protein
LEDKGNESVDDRGTSLKVDAKDIKLNGSAEIETGSALKAK